MCSVDFDDCSYEAGLLVGYVRRTGRLEKALLLLVQGPETGAVDLEVRGQASTVDLEVRVMVDAVNCHGAVSCFSVFLIHNWR
jgi:hypothetical protein